MNENTERNASLDLLRGIMLVIITINHTGGPFHNYTNQSFGFVSAAEGFIFLSGMLLGLVNGKRLLAHDFTLVKSTLLRRTLVIYFYHIITLVILLLPYCFDNPVFQKWQLFQLSTFIEHPVQAILQYLLLIYQPNLLDILPMYILYLLVGYLVIRGFYYNKEKAILFISFAVWFLSQFNWFEIVKFNPAEYGLFHLSEFNPFSWQLLFFTGCFLGFSSAKGKTFIPSSKKLTFLVILVCLAFFLIRHSFYNDWHIAKLLANRAGKPNLEIFRLINFYALAYLVYIVLQSGWKFRSIWLETLGRNSLQVFSFHILVLYYVSPFREQIASEGHAAEVTLQVLLVASLIIPALLHQYLIKKFPLIKSLGL